MGRRGICTCTCGLHMHTAMYPPCVPNAETGRTPVPSSASVSLLAHAPRASRTYLEYSTQPLLALTLAGLTLALALGSADSQIVHLDLNGSLSLHLPLTLGSAGCQIVKFDRRRRRCTAGKGETARHAERAANPTTCTQRHCTRVHACCACVHIASFTCTCKPRMHMQAVHAHASRAYAYERESSQSHSHTESLTHSHSHTSARC